jgi:1-acyl-sn-glycerol-3-phosphate acyltransferase
MGAFKKITGFFFSIYAFLLFVALMLVLFPFVIIASFFGKVKGGNMIYSICRLWADLALFFWGIFHRNIYEAPPAKGHAVVFVFNHISYIDIPFLMKAFRRQHIRVLGKAEMGKIPIFGYIYRKAVVSVDRESEKGRIKSVAELKKVLAKNISVVLAPEGTFNMTHQPLAPFYNGAFRVAVDTDTPVQPVLLLDGYDRMNYRSIFSLTPGRSRAVFLPEILPGKDAELLKQQTYNAMQDGLLRYKASWIKAT